MQRRNFLLATVLAPFAATLKPTDTVAEDSLGNTFVKCTATKTNTINFSDSCATVLFKYTDGHWIVESLEC